MSAKDLQSHIPERALLRSLNDVRAIEIQEDSTDRYSLLAMIIPACFHEFEEMLTANNFFLASSFLFSLGLRCSMQCVLCVCFFCYIGGSVSFPAQ